jgi:hypothetical protein
MLPPPRFETVSELPGRCDRCDAAAKLELTLPGGGGLLFCGHHANRHAADILRQAVRVAVVDGFDWRGLTATSA